MSTMNAANPTVSSAWDAPSNQETALRLDKMAYTLQRKLGPEYVAQRQGAGGSKVSYIEAHRAFDLANEVFGFNGWNTTVKSLEVDFLDFDENTLRWSVGVSAIVRVSLVDGAYREDVGCGKMDNCRYKAEAIDKAKKEAVTDATKRALRTFGSLMGSCLYDKGYLNDLKNLKPDKPKLNPQDVHRPGKTYDDPPARFRSEQGDNAGYHKPAQPAAGPSNTKGVQNNANKAPPVNKANNNNNVRPAGNNNANNQNRGGANQQQNANRNAGNQAQNNGRVQHANNAQVKQEPAAIEQEEEMMYEDDGTALLPPDGDNDAGTDYGDWDGVDDAEITALEDGAAEDSGFVDSVQVPAGKPSGNNGGRAPSAPVQGGPANRNNQQSGRGGQQGQGGHSRGNSLPENNAGSKRTFDEANADGSLAVPGGPDPKRMSPVERSRLIKQQQEAAAAAAASHDQETPAERAQRNREEALAKKAQQKAQSGGQNAQ